MKVYSGKRWRAGVLLAGVLLGGGVLGAGGRALGEDRLILMPGMKDAELSKLEFRSVLDPPPKEGVLVVSDVKTGVYFNREEFGAGEAVTAWLVLAYSGAWDGRGLETDFDLGVPGAKAVMSGSARVQLIRVKEGKEELVGESKGTMRGGRPMAVGRVQVASGGYWVNNGDVRNLVTGGAGSGGKLEAGDYVLRFWAEGQKSEGRFRVAVGDGVAATAASAARERVLLAVNGGWNAAAAGRGRRGGGPGPQTALTVRDAYLTLRSVEEFSTGLGLGIGDGPGSPHFSRVSELPSHDETFSISVEHVAGAPEKLRITLTPLRVAPTSGPATRPVAGPPTVAATRGSGAAGAGAGAGGTFMTYYPGLYLLVEGAGEARGRSVTSDRYFSANNLVGVMAVTKPEVIEMELSPDWSERSPIKGKVRVSVIVSSESVRYGPIADDGNGDAGIQRTVVGEHWVGILKSEPVEMTFKTPGGDQ